MLSVATRNDASSCGSIPNYASPDLRQVLANQLHSLQQWPVLTQFLLTLSLLPEQATWPSYLGTRCFILRQIFQYYRSSTISLTNSKLENTETPQLTRFQVTQFQTYIKKMEQHF